MWEVCVVYLFQISFQLFNTSVYFDIVAFVKSDRPKQFPGLTVRYVRGADPIIKLLDESKNVVETYVSFTLWKV
jgi:hypothetical protein